jgi:hypothetical protein
MLLLAVQASFTGFSSRRHPGDVEVQPPVKPA